MKINICDQIMGAGKTQAAISRMNSDVESPYLFITPYLSECDRIVEACKKRNFVQPKRTSETKGANIRSMIENGNNIASTHQLFRHFDDELAEKIRERHYKLILDESFQIIELISVSEEDVNLLVKGGLLKTKDDESIYLADQDYSGDLAAEIADVAKSGNVFRYGKHLYYWIFPKNVLEAFDEITVLTYLFGAQQLRYYFQMHGMSYEYIGVNKVGDRYEFGPYSPIETNKAEFRDKIHILDDAKLNHIGEYKFALSKSWYDKRKVSESRVHECNQLKNNIYNVFINRFHARSNECMWTTFKDAYSGIRGKGYTKGFVTCNARATNQFKDRKYLAYAINVFMPPMITSWFSQKGISVDQDQYALSEMLQWIWRSAIRDGGDINIYIPSKRMRELLIQWMNEDSTNNKVECDSSFRNRKTAPSDHEKASEYRSDNIPASKRRSKIQKKRLKESKSSY